MTTVHTGTCCAVRARGVVAAAPALQRAPVIPAPCRGAGHTCQHRHVSQKGKQKQKTTASACFSLFLCPSIPLLLPPVNLDYQSRSRLNFATISSD